MHMERSGDVVLSPFEALYAAGMLTWAFATASAEHLPVQPYENEMFRSLVACVIEHFSEAASPEADRTIAKLRDSLSTMDSLTRPPLALKVVD